MKKIYVKIYDDLSGELESNWRKLWKNSDIKSYFNSYDWFVTCKEYFGFKNFEILVFFEVNSIVALVPLVKLRKYGIEYYISPGGKYIDHSSILLKSTDKKLLKKVVLSLKSKGSFILPEVSEDGVLQIVKKDLVISQSNINYILPLKDPFLMVNKKDKGKINKLEKLYGSDIELKQENASLKLLKIVSRIDQKSYKSKKGISTFTNPSERKFFEVLISQNPEFVKINIIYYKKKAISYEIGILYENTYYGLNKSFDNKYQKLSPGKILAYKLFEELSKKGVETFDLCRGDDAFKRSFTNISKKQYDIFYTKNLFAKLILVSPLILRKKIVNSKFIYKTFLKTKMISKLFI